MSRSSNKQALPLLKNILFGEGIRAALIFLNGLTEHRFSGLYRFDDDALKNLYFYDRENPTVESSPSVPAMASYCVFVRNSGQRFIMENSLSDERVHDHPAQQEVQSYCGVPLVDRYGQVFGTICHFDLQPRSIALVDVELMEEMSWLLKQKTLLS
ncbi:MAG: hypothetical protein N5P05_000931 [Chroococcopsis gigantea SAG 12.99]|jgi:GAF domain-containing protein|nr:GAF domain-containing protein [Chlorogloea purpurea SAG 13.99]MDV2999325.1 hypothetical protein [Chroococcopsis gigantea SAG 12.99]